jgi:hypothetical protein
MSGVSARQHGELHAARDCAEFEGGERAAMAVSQSVIQKNGERKMAERKMGGE